MTYFQRFQKWLLTDHGRIFRNCLLTGITVTGFSASILPQTVYLKWLQNVFQSFKDGVPEALNPEIEALANQVLRETNLSEKEKGRIHFFTVFGFDTYTAGGTFFKTGAIVGMPRNFKYKSIDDVERGLIKLPSDLAEFVPWTSPAGIGVQKSWIQSENAQKFGIAREIYYANQHYVLYNTALRTAAIALAITVSRMVNVKFNLYQRSTKVRVLLYACSCTVAAALYFSVKDSLSCYWDEKVDREAASLGSDYRIGGIEFYEKQIQRNCALRTLLESRGKRAFTARGNFNTWIRTPNLNPSVRLDLLKELSIPSNA